MAGDPIDDMYRTMQPDPSGMPFDKVVRLIRDNVLVMAVDQGQAIVAVRSGVPLSTLGRIANLGMVAAPLAAIILSFWVGWWLAVTGIVIGAGCFLVARRECVKAVSSATLSNEKLFNAMLQRGVISLSYRSA